MGNKDKNQEKKRQRVSSSDAQAELAEETNGKQDGAFITLTVTEYQALIEKITHIEDKAKASDNRILSLEARLDEAQVEIESLKKKLGETSKTMDETKESLKFTQEEHSDLVERLTLCETEQSAQWSEITHQSIYNRRWNLIFYRVTESPDEDCPALVKDVLIEHLHLPEENVQSMKFCGAHRLGKQNSNKTRPLIVRFTCRADRDVVWKNRFNLKQSPIAMGEDYPKHIQDIRKKVLVPALKNLKKNQPRTNASVIGNRLIVNGKRYFHYDIPKEWLPTTSTESATSASNQLWQDDRRNGTDSQDLQV